MHGEIVIYKASDIPDFQIEVRMEEETVWLNRQQLAILFDRDIKTIGKHIANVLREELSDTSVIAKFATTATDGKIYQVEYYNLDLIISVGYRVKSKRGIQFRLWANRVLKDYLLKGYAVNHRVDRVEHHLNRLEKKVDEIDFKIKSQLPKTEGIFYEGQIFDAWQFVSQLIKEATDSILLIDNYIDENVLMLLAKRNPNVKATIFAGNVNKQLQTDLNKHNLQYQPIELKHFTKAHDRFLIIDEKTVYHIGASLKDLGKKWFAFSKINLNARDMIDKLN